MSRTCVYQGVVNVPMISYPHSAGLPNNITGSDSANTPDGTVFGFGGPTLNANSTINTTSIATIITPSGFRKCAFGSYFSGVGSYGGSFSYFRGQFFEFAGLRGGFQLGYGAIGSNQCYIQRGIIPVGNNDFTIQFFPSRITYGKTLNVLDMSPQASSQILSYGNGRWVWACISTLSSFNPNTGIFVFDPIRGALPELLVYPWYGNRPIKFAADLLYGNNYGWDSNAKLLSEFNWDGSSTFLNGQSNVVIFDQGASTNVSIAKPLLNGWRGNGNKNSFSPSGFYYVTFDMKQYFGVNFVNNSDTTNLNNAQAPTLDESGTFWVQKLNGPMYTSFGGTPFSTPYPLANQNVIVLPRNECCAENRIDLPILR